MPTAWHQRRQRWKIVEIVTSGCLLYGKRQIRFRQSHHHHISQNADRFYHQRYAGHYDGPGRRKQRNHFRAGKFQRNCAGSRPDMARQQMLFLPHCNGPTADERFRHLLGTGLLSNKIIKRSPGLSSGGSLVSINFCQPETNYFTVTVKSITLLLLLELVRNALAEVVVTSVQV